MGKDYLINVNFIKKQIFHIHVILSYSHFSHFDNIEFSQPCKKIILIIFGTKIQYVQHTEIFCKMCFLTSYVATVINFINLSVRFVFLHSLLQQLIRLHTPMNSLLSY